MSDVRLPVEWDALVLSIHEGDCILMIGPDAITESVEGRDVSLMSLFSSELRRQLPFDQSGYEPLSPSQVAQVFKDFRDPRSLRSVAHDFFGQRRDLTARPLTNLAALPFKLVIDTTPLNQMEQAFLEAGKRPIEEWYKNETPRPLDADFNSNRPLVYHIFGSTRDLKSLVLAENDFVDLLVCVISGNPRLPDRLLNSFSPDSCMLFLGFGVRHLSLRILLHVLNNGRTRNRSFALERFEDDIEHLSVEGAKLFFQQGQRIDFVDMELGDFTLELRHRYEEYEASQAGSPQGVGGKSSRAPLAFLSYCREDEAEAKRVSTRLEKLGVKIWVDVDQIRAGQRWDPQIERVIKRDVDYFIVLNSTTLARTSEGYVNRELKLALDRETTFRGVSFVCPVQVDETPLLEELEKFHRIDGKTDAGLEQLAKHLRRDFEERKKTIS
jgi:TIR domain/SIR2-like domain